MWIKTALSAAAGAGAFGALCLVRSQYERSALSVEWTELLTDKIQEDKTFVFLSDLHNNTFGPENQQLIKAIDAVHPHGILSGGDLMVVKKGCPDFQIPYGLLSDLASRYPVYCGNGNHENRMTWKRAHYGRTYEEYRDKLKEMGIHYLEDETAEFGDNIQIAGVDLDEAFYEKALLKKAPPMPDGYLRKKLGRKKEEGFLILLAHSPLYFKEYADWGADLTLSGHFHGGTIRLPWAGGVMTPQYQFFLPWCAGTFEEGEKHMVVSRGLGTHSINIRLNNRPQLVVLRLKKK